MKTYLKYLIGFVILSTIGFVAFKFFSDRNKILIPDIQLQSIDNKIVKLKSNSDKFRFLVFFDSFCEHCQAEAKAFQEHTDALENAEIIFISTEKMRNIRIFADDYNLKNIPNIAFCQIEPEDLAKHFGNMGFPTIFIYNPENQLVEKLSGEIKIERLVKYLD